MQWDNAPCRHSQFPHGQYYRKEAKGKPAFANLFCTVTSCWHRIPYQAPVIPTGDPQASVQPQPQQSVCFGHTEGRSCAGVFLLPHKVPETCPVGQGTSIVTDVPNQFVFFFWQPAPWCPMQKAGAEHDLAADHHYFIITQTLYHPYSAAGACIQLHILTQANSAVTSSEGHKYVRINQDSIH